jgi:hypothetical protein
MNTSRRTGALLALAFAVGCGGASNSEVCAVMPAGTNAGSGGSGETGGSGMPGTGGSAGGAGTRADGGAPDSAPMGACPSPASLNLAVHIVMEATWPASTATSEPARSTSGTWLAWG